MSLTNSNVIGKCDKEKDIYVVERVFDGMGNYKYFFFSYSLKSCSFHTMLFGINCMEDKRNTDKTVHVCIQIN